MAWKKGSSGNHNGRPKESKICADLLRLIVNEDDGKGIRKLRRILDKLVANAMTGESWAIEQVCNRLDGKPAQESTVTIDNKRSATDWSRDELVALLNEQSEDSERANTEAGREPEPNSVH